MKRARHSAEQILGKLRDASAMAAAGKTVEQLAQKLESDKLLRKTGIIDASTDGYIEHRKMSVGDHLTEYLADLNHTGCNPRHTQTVKCQLNRMIDDISAKHLGDLDAVKVQRHLRALKLRPVKQLRKTDAPTRTIGPRTVNAIRSAILAFLNWCVRTGRLPHNPCLHVPKVDETKDKRVKRRALTAEELARLVKASGIRGSFYLIAALTGLRMKEMGSITWGDIDLPQAALLVRAAIGKAKRDDWIALTPEVVAALQAHRPKDADPIDLVFRTLPTTRTFASDLKAANIEEYDSASRRIDRHALRTTTGTLLARAGVMPQETQRQMRHADIKTTLRHYTDLRLSDQTRAVAKLPRITPSIAAVNDADLVEASIPAAAKCPQQYPQHSVHETVRKDAAACEPVPPTGVKVIRQRPSVSSGKRASLRGRATRVSKAGDQDRTGDIQLGNRSPLPALHGEKACIHRVYHTFRAFASIRRQMPIIACNRGFSGARRYESGTESGTHLFGIVDRRAVEFEVNIFAA